MRTSTFDAADLTASQLGKSDLSGYGWDKIAAQRRERPELRNEPSKVEVRA